jgi:biopolymer transport protein ExbB
MADPLPTETAAQPPVAPDPAIGTAGPEPDALASPPGALDHALALIHAGGPVVIILIGFSVVALAIVFVKLWQFGRLRLGDRKSARDAIRLHQMGQSAEALSRARRSRNPTAHVLALAIEGHRRGYPEEAIREEAFRYGGDLLETLRSGFRPLEVIATLAPLLGLFGTVLGMISAFQRLEAAGNQVNPAILSGGIWEALLTTAVGLAVAIPVIVVLNWLERTVETLAHEMDSVITQLFTIDLVHGETSETPHERAPFRHAAATAGD